MPSRAYTSFLLAISVIYEDDIFTVSMPSRAYTSFLLPDWEGYKLNTPNYVSMPSRAYTSFLQIKDLADLDWYKIECQCPLGLIPHFYGTPSKT